MTELKNCVKSDTQLLLLLEFGTTSGFFFHISAAQAKIIRRGNPFRSRSLPLVPSSGRRWMFRLTAWYTALFHFSGNERFAQMHTLHRLASDEITVGAPRYPGLSIRPSQRVFPAFTTLPTTFARAPARTGCRIRRGRIPPRSCRGVCAPGDPPGQARRPDLRPG